MTTFLKNLFFSSPSSNEQTSVLFGEKNVAKRKRLIQGVIREANKEQRKIVEKYNRDYAEIR